ncbi:hypothetical protein MCOR29_004086 [Pyricularia oryzae]|nr:hypothetical protein MCOR29_004086 [Pyricularia oryzae]KAI6496915.1 hypothetical protein MCOR11_004678 [Pyricularia oryzae]
MGSPWGGLVDGLNMRCSWRIRDQGGMARRTLSLVFEAMLSSSTQQRPESLSPGCLDGLRRTCWAGGAQRLRQSHHWRQPQAAYTAKVSSNVRCLGVITGKEIQPWLMEMMLDSHLHTGIDMPPQGTVIFRQQVTCVVVEAAVLATTDGP